MTEPAHEPRDNARFRLLPEPVPLEHTTPSHPSGVILGLPSGLDWERDIVVPKAGG